MIWDVLFWVSVVSAFGLLVGMPMFSDFWEGDRLGYGLLIFVFLTFLMIVFAHLAGMVS